MSKQITHNGYLIVEVPKKVILIEVFKHRNTQYLDTYIDDYGIIKLPLGQWQLVADSDTVSEEVASKVADKIPSCLPGIIAGYRDYQTTETVNNALDSLLSLLRYHSIERAVILKQVKTEQ